MKLDIIYTLGPSSKDIKVIEHLLKTADGFRLNSSHISFNQLKEWLNQLKYIFKNNYKEIPVFIDLQGFKMRIGEYPNVEYVPKELSIVKQNRSTIANIIPVPHKEFFDNIKIGDILNLNDGKVILKAKSISCDKIDVEVLKNGTLSSFKGINLKNHPIAYKDLTERDKKIIEIGENYQFINYAFSFVYNGDEREIIKKYTNRIVIGKIERVETLKHIDNIALKFDKLWFCRGDLGVQSDVENIGKMQLKFSTILKNLTKPVYIAGEVLEHMTTHDFPTRTEIVHLNYILNDGYSGIVLSDETAIGKNPIAVSNFLSNFISKNLY